MNEPESPTSPSNGSPSSKRKFDDGPSSQSQQRGKRNRYISIACNECKRRKIKCNGQTPCQRCGNLSLECLYAPNCCNSNFKDSDEFKRMDAHISTLQQQVDSLFSNMNALKGQFNAGEISQGASSLGIPPQTRPFSPAPARPKSSSKHPRFRGPTSSAFSLGVAKSSLQNMGITAPEEGPEEGDVLTQDPSPAQSPRLSSLVAPKITIHPQKDPIWGVSREEAVRLCEVWQDEMGLMYPVAEHGDILKHIRMLYSFMESARRTGLAQMSLPGADAIQDDQTILLKIILAISMTLEGSGKSDAGKNMFYSARPQLETRLFRAPDVPSVRMLALAAMYLFHVDEESGAWRLIGLAARLAIEIGLHRNDSYVALFPCHIERGNALKLFWTIYVLDRRWSFGTGMPFALQEDDIDPLLQKPDETAPHLASMVAYSNIGSKVWHSVANANGSQGRISNEDIGYLDYQVVQWHRSMPDSLKYIPPSAAKSIEPYSLNNHRIRILLYLRANQMRILIYRPILHTAASILDNLSQAQTVVDVAKDTIRVLTEINQATNMYRSQQVMFHYFLLSALAVLFLAASHAPNEFSAQCRDEFYMALDLVRGLSADSYVSKRLWRTVKVLKEVGPKLGLNVRNTVNESAVAHSDAAVAMAGLAGHPMDELTMFANGTNVFGAVDSPNGMANELTNMFEAAGGYSGVVGNGFLMPPPSAAGASTSPGNGDVPANGSGADGIFGQDELSRILRELF